MINMVQTKKAPAKKEETDKNDVVIINLDRPREIRFGHMALKRLGAITGKTVTDMSADDLDLEQLEKIMYCGLLSDAKEHGENLLLEDMEVILDQASNF